MFCVFLLTLSLTVHQNAHVNKLSACEKGHSIRCLLYFQSSTVNIFKYKWKYLLRRILHASRGNSNPYVISNKQAYIQLSMGIYQFVPKKQNITAIIERPATGTNDRRQQFMNYCLTHPAKFSCAVECFLELNYAIFKDFLRHTERNEFFKVFLSPDLYIMWQYNCKEDKYICTLHHFCERDSQKFWKLCLWGYIT